MQRPDRRRDPYAWGSATTLTKGRTSDGQHALIDRGHYRGHTDTDRSARTTTVFAASDPRRLVSGDRPDEHPRLGDRSLAQRPDRGRDPFLDALLICFVL